jgi:hydroxymethylbilane synthase
VAVNAVIDHDAGEVRVRTMLGFPDGTRILEETMSAPIDSAADLGRRLAEAVTARGARELLREAEAVAFKDEMPERL